MISDGRVRDALDKVLNERDALREALFQVLVNLGEDTDGITTGARWDAVVTPKLADSVPQMVADYRREVESEIDEYARLTGAWEYGLRMADDEEPYSDISEDLDWLLDGGLATVDEQIVRRRKAGPWEIHPMNRSEP